MATLVHGHLETLLLAILAKGPAHGYAVIEQLRLDSNGTFDLAEGAVYPALHRLEQTRLIRSRWLKVSGRRRRVYELTAAARPALVERQQRWREFVDAVDAVLEGKPWPTNP